MMSDAVVLNPGQSIKPQIDEDGVLRLAKSLYGLEITKLKQLDGYDDLNYWIQAEDTDNPYIKQLWPNGYVLKIMNSMDSKKLDFVEAQNAMLIHLGKCGFKVPQPIRNRSGSLYSVETLATGQANYLPKHVVRLLSFQVGEVLKNVPQSEGLLYNAGSYLAAVDNSLKDFDHPALRTVKSIWMLESVPQLKQFLDVITEEERLKLIKMVIEEFEERVLPQMNTLEKGFIHGDYNEQNILVEDETHIASLLDFGDSHYGPYLFEVAIGLTYILIQTQRIESGKFFLKGYIEKHPLSPLEINLLKICICSRLCQSLVMGEYTFKKDPGNEYVISTSAGGWKILETLSRINEPQLLELWAM